jgi:uncharacterized delta-60 repeat protein
MNVSSQVGSIDSSFGSNGYSISDISNNLIGDESKSVFVKDDNSILVTGFVINTQGNKDIALVQYNENGIIDSSFGNNGVYTLNINDNDDYGSASVVQPDGKIITVGYSEGTNTDIIVFRLNTDGNLDNSFATNGVFTYDSGSNDKATRVKILTDNRILIGGTIAEDFGILKLLNNGTFDSSFGNSGITTTSFGSIRDEMNDMEVQNDGKILICGVGRKPVEVDFDSKDPVVLRYTSDGSLDTTFADNGIMDDHIDLNINNEEVTAIRELNNGQLIVCGMTEVESGTGIPIIKLKRFHSDGTFDNSYGTNGSFSSYGAVANSIIVQEDDKVLIGGHYFDIFAQPPTSRDFILLRVNIDGISDNNFGTTAPGVTITDLNNNSTDRGAHLAFQQGNKVLLTGFSRDNTTNDNNFAIARYNIDGNLSVEDFKTNHSKFILYSNLTENSFTIKNENAEIDSLSIDLYSLDGKKVDSFVNYQLGTDVKINHLKSGFYFLILSNQSNIWTFKVIKN